MGEVKAARVSQQCLVSLVCAVSLSILLSLYYVKVEHFSSGSGIHLSSGYYDEVRFLVYGRKCQIRDVDPYDKEVRQFVRTERTVQCTHVPPLTYMEKTADGTTAVLRIDKAVARAHYPAKLSCCYSPIRRGAKAAKPDNSLDVGKCVPFKDGDNATIPFVVVRCRGKRRDVYANAHAAVTSSSSLVDRLRRAREDDRVRSAPRPFSVVMIGVDSISRLNGLRTLPRTLEFLRTDGWIEMRGYNKIADNTYPNLMAVLTGIDGDASYEACLPIRAGRLDACPFMWYKFRDAGYVTAYAEDTAEISTFNFNKVGFATPPTDHYLRPLMLAAERELKVTDKYSLKYCLGPVSAADRIMSYALDFSTTYANHTSFGLFWMNSFSHNDLNMPSGMDGRLLRFFRDLEGSGALEHTVAVFFSDHGLRFGDIVQTKIGWLEERLPLMYVWTPPEFRKRHPEMYKNLRDNSARLTTPYDLHMTLQHLLALSGRSTDDDADQGVHGSSTPNIDPAIVATSGCSGCPQCRSLFTPIDLDRSCDDASISPHWCTCTSFSEVPTDSKLVKSAARFVVTQIMATIEAAGANVSVKCAPLRLSKVTISQTGQSWDGIHTYLLLFLETKPGNGKFEATVSTSAQVNDTTTAMPMDSAPEFRLYSSISRLNSYASQSRCVHSANLKKYCYCR